MDNGSLFLGGISAVIVLLAVLKWNARLLGNFFLRGILGMFCIYGINSILSMNELFSIIECNPLTFLTTGFLGFPGILLLYGIEILHII